MSHFIKFCILFRVFSPTALLPMARHRKKYIIGIISFVIRLVRNVANNMVPEYKAVEAVILPCAANTAVMTGINSLPYSLMVNTVLHPLFTNVVVVCRRRTPSPTVKAICNIRSVLEEIPFRSVVNIESAIIVEHNPTASARLGLIAKIAVLMIYHSPSPKDVG